MQTIITDVIFLNDSRSINIIKFTKLLKGETKMYYKINYKDVITGGMARLLFTVTVLRIVPAYGELFYLFYLAYGLWLHALEL